MNTTTTTARQCHDWHWIECDRPNCMNDGAEHVRVPGHERPLWLCPHHAQDVREGRNPEAQR